MNKLKELRRSTGMNQQELANEAIVSRSTISHVEAGKYPPSPRFAKKICSALSKILGMKVENWHVFPDDFEEVKL